MSSITELQVQLHEAIDSIDDPDKLLALHKVLKGSKSTFKPLTMDEYVASIDLAVKQVKEGNVSSISEFEKETESW